MKQAFYLALSLCLFTALGCVDPITVGSDLLDDDRANLLQTMDVGFEVNTVRNDSILAFDASENRLIGTITFGQISDDVSGTVKHGAYIVPTLPRSTSTGLVRPPAFAFDPATLVDSVVLILPIDTVTKTYGPGTEFPYRLRQLASMVTENQDYYSNDRQIQGFNDLNANNVLRPNYNEATLLYDTIYSGGDSTLRPHVRVRFDDQFVEQLNLRDEATFESDTTFQDFLAGFYLEPTGDSDGLMPLQFQRSGLASQASLLFFYPDTSDQDPTFYSAPLSLWLPLYEQDYSDSQFGSLLNSTSTAENFALSGQAGLMAELNFTDLTILQDVVINEAKLTFYRADTDGLDYDDFPAPQLIAMYYRNNDGVLVPIQDRQRLLASNSLSAVERFLGGDPQEDDDGNIFYEQRLTVHMQGILNGDYPPTVYIRVTPLDTNPARLLLKGPGAAELGATIRVTYTELD